MHQANIMFLKYVGVRYAEYLLGTVYEFGSMAVDANDRNAVRNITPNAEHHVGVDWRFGPNVDVVSLAHEIEVPAPVDAVISTSMLEHDPYWEKSLDRMVEILKPGGLFVLSWGAALNPMHCLDHAPDGLFHPLKAGPVLNRLRSLNVELIEFLYEGNRYPDCGGGMGEVALVGFKNAAPATFPKMIDKLLPEDI
jgi:hypothetical protein